jgi:signal transduction histidine kinase/CheY-like chemotaxis protein
MGERIRTLDWTTPPLGPIEGWPQSLKTAIGIMLGAHSPVAVFWGADHILLYNDPYRKMIGKKHPQGLGRPAREVYPEVWDELAPMFERVMSGLGATAAQDQLLPIDRNGSIEDAWFDFSLNPIPCEDGSICGIFNFALETTRKVHAEKALRDSEERYRRLFTSMTEAFALGEPILDEEGRPQDFRLLEINEAFEKQTGLSRDIIGKPASLALPGLEDYWVQTYCSVALGGGPVDFEQFNRDTDRWYAVHCYSPAAGRFAILFRDITRSHRMQEELRESEERFRALVTASSEVLYRMSPDWSEMRRLSSRDFLASTEKPNHAWLRDYIPPEDQAQVTSAIDEAIRTKSVFELEHRVLKADGSLGWTFSRAIPLMDNRGEILEWFGAATDVTARKQAEKRLREAKNAAEEASRAKSEFLANMSHEIRTPMTVFMSAIEHLLQIDRNPERRQLLGMADVSARRLRALIDDILDFSRIEARKVELEEGPFDLRACVREAIDMFTLPAREKDLTLESEVSADSPEKVLGDPNRVGQVLINLIGNAVKFTREGTVRVCVQPRGDLLEFSVADTGIGIPKEKLPLIFESFSQVDMSFHRQHEGSGLGLAISKGLVELMGGEISIQSRLGEGSVFTFTVPLKTIERAAFELHQAPPEGPDGGRPQVRILLAEDEPLIREMITMMLQQRGYRTETAGTGRDALRRWEEGDFDLIFMDLQMPEMNGMEATRAIRQQEKEGEKRTCIIGLTAHVRHEVKEECLASGMDRVLAKPVQMNDLFSAIEACLTD